jgi:SAM-dependent methyltransferase
VRSNKQDLVEHLNLYGIRQFYDDRYWQWGGEQLGDRNAQTLNRLRAPLQEGCATAEEMCKFYDFISEPNIGAVVHSSKADAIRASGEAIEGRLGARARILDLGCGLGYLTTWYASLNSDRHVIGVDISEKSVRQARRLARRLCIRNVEFLVADIADKIPGGIHDAVVDSQCLSTLTSYSPDAFSRSLTNLRSILTPDGILICVSAIGDSPSAHEFIEGLRKSGFGILSFEFIFHADLNEKQAYTLTIAQPGMHSMDLDLEQEYEQAYKKLFG